MPNDQIHERHTILVRGCRSINTGSYAIGSRPSPFSLDKPSCGDWISIGCTVWCEFCKWDEELISVCGFWSLYCSLPSELPAVFTQLEKPSSSSFHPRGFRGMKGFAKIVNGWSERREICWQRKSSTTWIDPEYPGHVSKLRSQKTLTHCCGSGRSLQYIHIFILACPVCVAFS